MFLENAFKSFKEAQHTADVALDYYLRHVEEDIKEALKPFQIRVRELNIWPPRIEVKAYLSESRRSFCVMVYTDYDPELPSSPYDQFNYKADSHYDLAFVKKIQNFVVNDWIKRKHWTKPAETPADVFELSEQTIADIRNAIYDAWEPHDADCMQAYGKIYGRAYDMVFKPNHIEITRAGHESEVIIRFTYLKADDALTTILAERLRDATRVEAAREKFREVFYKIT
jgi:hypothetical protein